MSGKEAIPEFRETTPKEITDAIDKKKKKPVRKLIFLLGFKNTGKDTVAEILKEVSVEPVERVAFADALKKEIYPKLGGSYDDPKTEDREWKDKHRAEIIAYGESQKHEKGMYHWVNTALGGLLTRKYERAVDVPHIIVTDCRRIEEVLWFKHFKLGHFSELKAANIVYEPVFYVVHKKDAEIEDKDYLTHICVEYCTETRVIHGVLRNYGTLKQLKNLVKDWYVTKIK